MLVTMSAVSWSIGEAGGAIRRSAISAAMLAGLSLAISSGGVEAASPRSSLLDALRRLQTEAEGDAVGPRFETDTQTWSVESPIDPLRYRMLPGDQVSLGIWGENPQTFTLRVAPEGELLIPQLGPVRVAGLTLAEAEARVQEVMRPLYLRTRITMRLVEPGIFRISLSGMVARPGIYEAQGGDRLSMALEAAGGVRPGGSLRRIRLYSPSPGGDGTALLTSKDQSASSSAEEVDLLPWLLSGNLETNRVLEPGVSIEVPPQGSTVRIRGPVHGRSSPAAPTTPPGRVGDRPEEEPDLVLEWREGDTVRALLAQAGGLSERATGTGWLHREGEPVSKLDLNRTSDLETLLRPNDLLEVDYSARWIYVVGAVRAPGRYAYLPGMVAADYVAIAGGPTEVGRSTDWSLTNSEGVTTDAANRSELLPGSTLRVPERRTYKLATYLGPLSSATALILSLVALTR